MSKRLLFENVVKSDAYRQLSEKASNGLEPVARKWYEQTARNSFVSGAVAGFGGAEFDLVRPALLETVERQNALLEAGATQSTDVGAYLSMIFSNLRTYWYASTFHNLVSIQPTNGPIAAISTLAFKSGSAKNGVAVGDNIMLPSKADLSSQYISTELLVTVGGSADATVAGECNHIPVLPKNTTTGVVTTITGAKSGSGTITITDDGAGALLYLGEEVGTIDYTTGAINIDLSGASGSPQFAASAAINVAYHVNYEGIVGSDLPSGAGADASSEIPTITGNFTTESIGVRSRKVAFRVSVEGMQDAQALWQSDLVSMLNENASSLLAAEMDKEVITDLVNMAEHGITFTIGPTFGGADIVRPQEARLEVLTSINAISAKMSETTRQRIGASKLVVNPTVASLFSALAYNSMYNGSGGGPVQPGQSTMTGNVVAFPQFRIPGLGYNIDGFVTPVAPANSILLAARGQGGEADYRNSGYVVAPYIPMQQYGRFDNPSDQHTTVSYMGRYAKKAVDSNYYGVITVSGLPSVT